MKLRNLLSLVILIVLIVSLSACTQNKNLPYSIQEGNEKSGIENMLSQSSDLDNANISSNVNENDKDYSPEDMAAWTTNFPSFAYAFSMDEKELEKEESYGIDEIIYDGKDINVFCKLTAGGYSDTEIGLRVFVDGIAQVISDKNDNENLVCVKLDKGESKTVKLSFQPNIGKKGEVLNLCFELITLPNIIKDENSSYSTYEDGSSFVGNIKLIMKSDAVATADSSICNRFSSDMKSKVNKLIYQSCISDNGEEQINEYYDQIGLGIYQNIEDYVYREKTDNVICVNTKIKTKSSQNTPLTLNLNGKPGKYRISFFLNNNLLDVFDGNKSADVSIEKGKQTELKISFDTTKLQKNNNVCICAQPLNDGFDPDNVIIKSLVYQLIITDAK